MMRSLRWPLVILVTAAIAVGYLDRLSLPVAIKAVERSIPLSDAQFGYLTTLFYLGYALMYMGGGRLMDALGTRRGFLLIMVWWSLACAGHGLAAGFWGLAAGRLLLGLGQGGSFPAAAKAVAEWFPARQRATAMGLVNAGSSVGAVFAPPAIALVLRYLSWPWVFYLSGGLGLVWTLWWLRDYYPAAEHPRLSDHERVEISEVLTAVPRDSVHIPWLRLLVLPQVWGMVLGKGLCDAVWFTYAFWLPKYLGDIHGLDANQLGMVAWIPYAASGVGSFAGGWWSSRLVRRGHSLDFARKVVLGASAAVMPCMLLVSGASTAGAIALFSLAFFAHLSFSTLVITLPADLFPRRLVGSVAGLVGFGGSVGGMLFNLVAGGLLEHLGRAKGYPVLFAIGSTFHILGFFWILLTICHIRPIARPEPAGSPAADTEPVGLVP